MKTVIIGGVAGGAGAAARLRRNDETAEIIMFERGEFISFANCGLPYHIGNVIKERSNLLLQTPESFNDRFNVDVRVFSEVIDIDFDKKEVTVKDLKINKTYNESYDNLIISCGAKPIMPPIPGSENENVFTLRNIPDTYDIMSFERKSTTKKACVIGGGFIGMEMAENLRHIGLEVSVVEASDHIIAALDGDMSYDIQNYIRQKGINLYLNSLAVEIKENAVVLKDGSEIEADLIIMSIGVSPDTEFLKNTKLNLGERGEIIVDEYLQTNIKDVYAVGDAIRVKTFPSNRDAIIPLAGPANKQARIVADNIAGKKLPYKGTQGTAIAKIFDMVVAVTGESEKSLKTAGADYLKALTYSYSNATYYPNCSPMEIKILFDKKGLLLGAQIVGGKGVDKRIDVLATAIRGKMTVYDLTELELAYAPPFSSAKDPVNMAGYVATNILEGRTSPVFYEELDHEFDDADTIYLDVRTREEYEAGHLKNFINISVDDLRDNLDKLDKDKEILITCRIGLRGYVAEQILRQSGFKTKNLAGGYRHAFACENNR